MCQICEQVKQEVELWSSQQSHDRCWYYPDVFAKIAEIVGAKVDQPKGLPPLHEFKDGCCRFQKSEFGDEFH